VRSRPPQVGAAPAAAPAAARPITPLQSLLIVVLTATAVVVAGIWIVESKLSASPGVASAAPSAAPPTGTAPQPSSASPIAAASPEKAPPQRAPDPPARSEPRVPPPGYAYLTVTYPEPATVFLNGTMAGEANESMKVVCGRFFMRLGRFVDGGKLPLWIAPGTTVLVPCQGSMTVALNPP
jgi:hypothetical protein